MKNVKATALAAAILAAARAVAWAIFLATPSERANLADRIEPHG